MYFVKPLMLIGLCTVIPLTAGCAHTPTSHGALAGGALGAGLGALIGNQTGDAGEGALVGAGVGALSGALIGNAFERRDRYDHHRHYGPPQVVERRVVETRPSGHYETHLIRSPNGEYYEERVWVPHR